MNDNEVIESELLGVETTRKALGNVGDRKPWQLPAPIAPIADGKWGLP